MKMGQFCFKEGWVSTHRLTQMINPAAAVKTSPGTGRYMRF
jgi:hypothetical protein